MSVTRRWRKTIALSVRRLVGRRRTVVGTAAASGAAHCRSRVAGSSWMVTGIRIFARWFVVRSFDAGSILASCFATVVIAPLALRPYLQIFLVLVARLRSLHLFLVVLRPHHALILAWFHSLVGTRPHTLAILGIARLARFLSLRNA